MGRELAPVRARGAAWIAFHDFEIDRPIGVRQHIPTPVPVDRRIEQILLARVEHGRRCFWRARGDGQQFRLAVVARGDGDELTAFGEAHADEEAVVRLVIHQNILAPARGAAEEVIGRA